MEIGFLLAMVIFIICIGMIGQELGGTPLALLLMAGFVYSFWDFFMRLLARV